MTRSRRRYISMPVELPTGDRAQLFIPADITRPEWARIIAAMNAYLAVPNPPGPPPGPGRHNGHHSTGGGVAVEQRMGGSQMSNQQQPPAPGTLSPDGRFTWDGVQWVPNTAPPMVATTTVAKKGHLWRNIGCGCLGLVALLVVIAIATSSGNKTTNNSTASSTNPEPGATAAKSAAPAASPTPNVPHFGDGTHRVGTDIQAGTYRTRKASGGCYWARLKGFSGALSDLAANENTDYPTVVTIKPTDAGFESRSCGTWTADLTQITKSQTAFDSGIFIVGTDVVPGTYRSTGSSGCYWARLRGFSGELGDVISNGNTDTPAVVTIAVGDKGFKANNCGSWSQG